MLRRGPKIDPSGTPQIILTLSWRRSLSYRNQCRTNQWIGFYIISISVMKELRLHVFIGPVCTKYFLFEI